MHLANNGHFLTPHLCHEERHMGETEVGHSGLQSGDDAPDEWAQARVEDSSVFAQQEALAAHLCRERDCVKDLLKNLGDVLFLF